MIVLLAIAALLVIPVVAWIKHVRARRNPPSDGWGYRSTPSPESAIWTTCIVLVIGILVGIPMFSLILAGIFGDLRVTSSSELAALRTGSDVEGQFFLGSGTIDEKQVFSYLVRDADGGVRLKSQDAAASTVYEDGDGAPRLDVFCRVLDNPWIAPVTFSPGIGCRYNFHVPAGSVLQSYEVAP